MQRRVVEDSAKRIQALFQQLAAQQLSPPVISTLHQICNCMSPVLGSHI